MSSDTQKTYQRDVTRGDDFGSRHGVIGKELQSLIKSGASDYKVLQQLKQRYGDDKKMIDSIFDAYKERLQLITKKARKFRQFIYEKWPNLNKIEKVKKAKKYAAKIPLSDDEFAIFLNLILTDKAFYSSTLQSMPNTAMAKLLGFVSNETVYNELSYDVKEVDVLDEILKLHAQTKVLHSQVTLQSVTYRDCAPEALSGSVEWSPHKKNVYSFVHPVIAALFLPKVKLLDENMLIANIGSILKAKKEKSAPMTQPDFELYWNLITDPTESTCSDISPLKDLMKRYILQTRLWDSVLNLRQGIFYDDKLNGFLDAINECKNNIYDSPDLTYVKDEGTILRRLLAAFSIRPTLVNITRLYGMGLLDSFGFGMNPMMSSGGISNLTTVPMITLRLPINVTMGSQQQAAAIHLQDSLAQPQWYVENKTIVPKTQTILHSRDVIFFYINRRFQTINLSRMSYPCNFTNLPMTVAGWESLNDRCVSFDTSMPIMNDTYQLRSVVMVERAQAYQNLIIGCTAAIIVPRDYERDIVSETALLYDPQGAAIMTQASTGNFQRSKPISWIPVTPSFYGASGESFYERASTRGTIFMYQKVAPSEFCQEKHDIVFAGY